MVNTPTRRGRTTRSRSSRTIDEDTTHRDQGYTLIELLCVILLLGVLGSIAVLTLTGVTSEAADTGCRADRRQLHVATEAFFAQTSHDLIPPTGADHDRYERTLVTQGLLDRTSTHHDLTAEGAVTQEHPSC